MPKLVLDANMLIVFVVGTVEPKLLGSIKRVKEYQPTDFDLLSTYLNLFDEIILLPKTISEASNLLRHVKGERRQDCLYVLASIARSGVGRYLPSVLAVEQPEYQSLGVTDAAILCVLDEDTFLLSADLDLCLAATFRSREAQYFWHLRQYAE